MLTHLCSWRELNTSTWLVWRETFESGQKNTAEARESFSLDYCYYLNYFLAQLTSSAVFHIPISKNVSSGAFFKR